MAWSIALVQFQPLMWLDCTNNNNELLNSLLINNFLSKHGPARHYRYWWWEKADFLAGAEEVLIILIILNLMFHRLLLTSSFSLMTSQHFVLIALAVRTPAWGRQTENYKDNFLLCLNFDLSQSSQVGQYKCKSLFSCCSRLVGCNFIHLKYDLATTWITSFTSDWHQRPRSQGSAFFHVNISQEAWR